MALDDVFTVTRPNQRNADTTDPFALAVAEYSGIVEGTIARRSVTQGWIPVKNIRGTSSIRDEAVGGAGLVKITPGATPDGQGATKFGRSTLTIEAHCLARETMALLDTFQMDRDKRAEIGEEHGKHIAKFMDKALLIQAIKASQRTTSMFHDGTTELPNHAGGSTATFANAGDVSDPALFIAKLIELIKTMEGKDIDMHKDGLVLIVKPTEFWTLAQAEQLINQDYVTAMGNKVEGGMVLKTYGIPVVSTNNYAGGENISGHLLSTTLNSDAFDGNYTKVKATLCSPRAVLAAENIPVTSEVFYGQKEKLWFIDSHFAMSAQPRRTEFSGSLLLP
jgi:hypothetical protein